MDESLERILAGLLGSPHDHFNQETGSYVLSLAEQIGRAVALREVLECEDGREALRRTIGLLEAELEVLTARTRGPLRPAQAPAPKETPLPYVSGSPGATTAATTPASTETKPNAEELWDSGRPLVLPPALLEADGLPRPLRNAKVTYQVPSPLGLQEPREGRLVGLKDTRRGLWVHIKDIQTKALVTARPGHVRVVSQVAK